MIIRYVRVSTQDQDPQLQRDALCGAACEQVFQERVTGTQRERPELNACQRSLREGYTPVVWKLERLARSLKDLVTIASELEERGVGFRPITEAIDTSSNAGRLVFHIFGALAEFERNLILERTIPGLKAARPRGRKGERKPALSRADVRRVAAMLADPMMTKTEVARYLGVSKVTLNALPKRRVTDRRPSVCFYLLCQGPPAAQNPIDSQR